MSRSRQRGLQADLLALLLAQLPEDANLTELNRTLARQKIPMAVERRKAA